MLFKKKKLKYATTSVDGTDEYYLEAAAIAGGVGGFGREIPKSKEGYKAGWWCPNCESIYAPTVKECKECNKRNKELKEEKIISPDDMEEGQ